MLLHDNSFTFVPLDKPSPWTWTLENGQPRLWWIARVSEHVVLSDGRDIQKCESHVCVEIGTQTSSDKGPHATASAPTAKWGTIVARGKPDGLVARVAISKENFDRILLSIHSVAPPTVTVAFGPEHGPLQGAITKDALSNVYRWNDAAEREISIATCEFVQAQERAPRYAPVASDDFPTAIRGVGIASALGTNLIAIAIALVAFRSANDRFETAVVSLILLVYVVIVNRWTQLGQTLVRGQLRWIERFLQLRTLAGVPTGGDLQMYLWREVEQKLRKPDAGYWINGTGCTIIAVMAIYKLTTLLFSM